VISAVIAATVVPVVAAAMIANRNVGATVPAVVVVDLLALEVLP
jgi:hypothetical protein